jgi:23S rRNA (pseudouridine1915-N3)-methyltransferase
VEIQVVAVGRVRSPLDEAVREYETRASRYFKFTVAEVEAGVRGGGKSAAPEDVMAAEGERILSHIDPAATVLALTRDGKPMGSTELARFLEAEALASTRHVAFVIGGAFGLGSAVLDRARRRLSISDMTLPHEMARLILAEQIYRAGTIQRGEPYHKGNDDPSHGLAGGAKQGRGTRRKGRRS